MKNRTRNILIIVASVFLVLGGLGLYGVYRIYKYVTRFSTPRELPAEIKDARVLKGQDFLAKREFFKLDRQSLLKTMGKSSGIENEEERAKYTQSQIAKGIYNFSDLKVIGNEIVAVGEFGAFIFERNGNLKRTVAFDLAKEKIKIGPYEKDDFRAELDNIQIVQLATNFYGFLSYGSFQGVRIFDQNGHQIWEYGRKTDLKGNSRVLEAAVGDLDNDGYSEYVVARKNDGIHAFDRTGRELWSQPADFPNDRFFVRDLDGDGKNELIQLGSYVRAGIDGSYIRQIKGGRYAAILFVPDPTKGLAIQFCDEWENRMSCEDEQGTEFLDGEAPLNELKNPEPPDERYPQFYQDTVSIAEPRAAWVTLKKDKPKYLAVVGAYIGLPRANLYIYEPNGTLVYHELLPENAQTIAVLPGEDGLEGLLVGGKDTIWKYGN